MTEHIFALYAPDLMVSPAALSSTITIAKGDLFHRLVHVLRVEIGQKIIVFNREHHWQMVVERIDAKNITLSLMSINTNTVLQPTITLFIPLLKREDLAEAVAGAVEAGVTNIQLVITARTQRKWQGNNELERLMRIAIAASEQCKQFTVPEIYPPLPLGQMLQQYKQVTYITCAVDGLPVMDLVPTIQKSKHIGIFFGPEGDFTPDEYTLLSSDSHMMRLTPTILRAATVATLSVALVRSLQ